MITMLTVMLITLEEANAVTVMIRMTAISEGVIMMLK